jgi:hypothetical protein
MTSFLRGYLLLIVLGMSGVPAYAEWVPIDGTYQSPGLRTIYIDRASIRREGDLVTLSVLIDWRSMQGGRSPSRFYSTTLKKQFDCASTRLRRLAFTDFYGHMGTGPSIASYESEGSWLAVEPESLSQGLWEAACGKK